MKFEELLQQSNTLLKKVEKINERIAKIIVKELKDIIPDLKWSIGWAEAGIETICFYSDSHNVVSGYGPECSLFDWVIEEALPEFSQSLTIICPYGVYLAKEEAQSVRERLKKLKGMTL